RALRRQGGHRLGLAPSGARCVPGRAGTSGRKGRATLSGAPGRDPPRWTEVGGDSPLARRAGELLRLPAPPPLGPVRHARIRLRLSSRPAVIPGWWRARHGLAAALLLSVVAAATAAAATGRLGGWLSRARDALAGGNEPASRPASAVEQRRPQQGQREEGEPSRVEPPRAAPP